MPSLPPHASAVAPIRFLTTMAFINWLGFAGWQALLNNFAKEEAGFTGWDIGLLQSVREVPGFLAFTAAAWFLLMREQTLAYLSLLMLGIGIAVTGALPSFQGLLLTTFIMSVGFHYFETANQALSLQLLSKRDAPKGLGQIASAAAAAQLVAYSLIALVSALFSPSYAALYAGFGIGTILLAGLAAARFGRFQGAVPQRRGIVLRRRYWLYYALTFLSGARRQIFMAFGGWLLVERFSYGLSAFSGLLFLACGITVLAGPVIGRLIGRVGERRTIVVENVSLIVVFVGYATTTSAALAGALFVLDGVFFTLTIAQRTYFQKIADGADIAPTAAVAFTINHIAAVVIPVLFGALWIRNPDAVFSIGALIATASLALAFLVPRDPGPGQETVFAPVGAPVPAE